MVDKETKSYLEDAGNVEDVTNALVVVVLRPAGAGGVPAVLGVPAVAIVRHLLARWLLSWSLKRHVCS